MGSLPHAHDVRHGDVTVDARGRTRRREQGVRAGGLVQRVGHVGVGQVLGAAPPRPPGAQPHAACARIHVADGALGRREGQVHDASLVDADAGVRGHRGRTLRQRTHGRPLAGLVAPHPADPVRVGQVRGHGQPVEVGSRARGRGGALVVEEEEAFVGEPHQGRDACLARADRRDDWANPHLDGRAIGLSHADSIARSDSMHTHSKSPGELSFLGARSDDRQRVSRCAVDLWQRGQYFASSRRSGVLRRFFVVM